MGPDVRPRAARYSNVSTEVTQSIVREIRATLTPLEKQNLATTRRINPEAHETYLKGRYYWNKRTEASLKKAIEYFEGSIEQDPGYALAYE